MKKTATKEIETPEVVYDVATWKGATFKPQLIQCPQPHEGLDAAGRIMFFHALSMEACKASISAALFTALELYRQKLSHPRTFDAWCEMNLKHGSVKLSKTTVYRYLKLLGKTLGKNVNIDELAHDTSKNQIDAVTTFTKYTKFSSLNEIYSAEGIVSKTTMGGKRTGAGRKRKDAKREEELEASLKRQEEELGAESIRQRVADLFAAAVTGGGLGNCDDKDLKSAVDILRQIVKTAEEILKSRKSK